MNMLFPQAFVELEELTKEGDVLEWKETARWIKFEEDVEVSNRWGKPHVASLSFHSLLELRQALEKGKHFTNIPAYIVIMIHTSHRKPGKSFNITNMASSFRRF